MDIYSFISFLFTPENMNNVIVLSPSKYQQTIYLDLLEIVHTQD